MTAAAASNHPTARSAAARALARAAAAWPDLDPAALDLTGLDGRDARLALAIQRTALQRWITLAYLLDEHLRQPIRSLEPMLQGLLLSATAQIIFMDRMPAHAVVDESVELAKSLIRPGAAGLANAVLRKIAALPESPVRGKPWTRARDRLPLDDGYVPLSQPCLPELDPPERYISIATACPTALLHQWTTRWGPGPATRLALQSLVTPPTIVGVEPGFSSSPDPRYEPHSLPGFLVWRGSHQDLSSFLADHPARRVQDPASTRPVAATAGLSPKLILDYCAGRGTKSLQLLAGHPEAELIAADIDPRKLADLKRVLARSPRATVAEVGGVQQLLAGRRADLVLLDVPCSNTAVLARRPEAKFRFSAASLSSLATLQAGIVSQSLRFAAPGATLIYSTCSLEDRENQAQSQRVPGRIIRQETTLPEGRDTAYHDGGYFAVIRLSASLPAVEFWLELRRRENFAGKNSHFSYGRSRCARSTRRRASR